MTWSAAGTSKLSLLALLLGWATGAHGQVDGCAELSRQACLDPGAVCTATNKACVYDASFQCACPATTTTGSLDGCSGKSQFECLGAFCASTNVACGYSAATGCVCTDGCNNRITDCATFNCTATGTPCVAPASFGSTCQCPVVTTGVGSQTTTGVGSQTTTGVRSQTTTGVVSQTGSTTGAPACVPRTCSPNACGSTDDGCGRLLNCGLNCTAFPNSYCNATSNTCECNPKTCDTLGYSCGPNGTLSDACGGSIAADSCGTCNLTTKCDHGTCQALGCNSTTSCAAENRICGTLLVGAPPCVAVSCGQCTSPEACDGSGQCVCAPSSSCIGLCGTVDLGCGLVDCGDACPADQVCGTNNTCVFSTTSSTTVIPPVSTSARNEEPVTGAALLSVRVNVSLMAVALVLSAPCSVHISVL